jgi:O-acetyl-ADP-ribose deacetylase (regulator of RNase III)
MTRLETIHKLIMMLLQDLPQYRAEALSFTGDEQSQRRLLRSLMNVRPPLPLSAEYCALQDELLSAEREAKGVVHVSGLVPSAADPGMYLWQGDITRLDADAVVNAANSALLGCFCPCHGCIDNAIHSAAGLQLRRECSELMAEQGHDEGTGLAKITGAYNLPSKYVIHTVGPVVSCVNSDGSPHVTDSDRVLLSSCYRHCISLALSHRDENGASDSHSIAFCCISTGEFHFPNLEAAQIAVQTVRRCLDRSGGQELKVVFNVFKDADYDIYDSLLGKRSVQ